MDLRRDALERLAELIVAVERAHLVRVAIDGVDGAGKTTLADELAPLVERRGRPVVRASLDGFHRPRAERYLRGSLSPEGYDHDSFDLDALRRELLEPLGPGGDRRYRAAVFDLDRDESARDPRRTADRGAVLLLDGVFLQRPELDDLWDLRVFVRVDPTEALRRALERDVAAFGSRAEAERRYALRYEPGQRRYLEAVHPAARADAVLDNSEPARPYLRVRCVP